MKLRFARRQGSIRMCAAPSDGPALIAVGLSGKLPVEPLNLFFGDTDDDKSKNT
jgi:hypothetical protein